ncbi:uncharacterized protein [Branchiostoma lanceolatum]|uniref:uncharacterized protein n=1 Tax=Branchiostoma lanceolatum TaxID=7740 RepID=UPI003452F329
MAPSRKKRKLRRNIHRHVKYKKQDTSLLTAGTSSTSNQPHVASFDTLPLECRVLIFSFLSDWDKCTASTVSKSWFATIRSPILWQTVDFTTFSVDTRDDFYKDYVQTALAPLDWKGHVLYCFNCYKKRLDHYARYLRSVKAAVKHLRFQFDLGHPEDRFGRMLINVLRGVNCRNLVALDAMWSQTLCRPLMPHPSDYFPPYESPPLGKVKAFQEFLKVLVAVAPNLRQAMLPFDWSFESTSLLTQFRYLTELHLKYYWIFSVLSQEQLTALLKGLIHLKKFTLQLRNRITPGSLHELQYTMESKSVQLLDISGCQGFFLRGMNMPQLQRIWVSRPRWSGPLIILNEHSFIPRCVYCVLVEGAPALKVINSYRLEENWTRGMSAELHRTLRHACSCQKHLNSWALM